MHKRAIFPRHKKSSPKETKTLSILVPVYNEQATLAKILARVWKAPTPDFRKEIIVVDDGSTDKSLAILRKLQARYRLKIATHPYNLGKGAAIRTGLGLASGEAILTQDADLEYDPCDYPALLATFRPKISPVVYGSRNLYPNKRGYLLAHLCGQMLTRLTNFLFGTSLTDVNTGYKLFRADIIRNADLQVDGFDFCHEITDKVLMAGYKIKEVPIRYAARSFREGKKVNVKDALLDLLTTFRFRFTRSSRNGQQLQPKTAPPPL